MAAERTRIRREPPRFREAVVVSSEFLTPRLVRVLVSGAELAGLSIDEPAASVRLLVPSPGDDGVIIPEWHGNEFLRPDGSRPIIRTLTPRHYDSDTLTLEIVLHEDGALSEWAALAEVGDRVAISGTGRGYEIDPDGAGWLLAGDESAIPAISQLLEWLPSTKPVRAIIEVADPRARLTLPSHPMAAAEWLDLTNGAAPGDALVDAVESFDVPDRWRVWVAGEAAAMFRVRKHLFDTLGLERKHAMIRGYWKHGRASPGS